MIDTNIDRKLTRNGFLTQNGMYVFDNKRIIVQVKICNNKAVTIYADCIEGVTKVVEYSLLNVADETVSLTIKLLNSHTTIGEIK